MSNIKHINSPVYLVVCLLILFAVSMFSQKALKIYERSVVVKEAENNRDTGELAIIDYYRSLPVEKFFKYKTFKILRRVNDYQFEVLSTTEADLVEAKIIWADYAVFKDKDGKYIPRTSPCLTKPTDDAYLKEFCQKQSKKYWFQFQFWVRENFTRKGIKSTKWIYKQALIPPDAVTMEICSDQTITVHKNKRFGDVEKLQHVCTDEFTL